MGARQSVSTPSTPKRKKTGGTPHLMKSKSSGDIDFILQPYQKSLLRQAWGKINKNEGQGGSVGAMILRRMLAKNPAIKKVFQQYVVIAGVFNFGMAGMTAHHNHTILFVQLIDMAVNNLDDMDVVATRCQEFGRQHAQYANYGMTSDHWDTFGEAITESSREWEGWRKHRETLKAWTVLVSFISDRLRSGYDQALRKNTLSTASAAARLLRQASLTEDLSVASTNSCRPANAVAANHHQPPRRRSSAVPCASAVTAVNTAGGQKKSCPVATGLNVKALRHRGSAEAVLAQREQDLRRNNSAGRECDYFPSGNTDNQWEAL